MKLGYRGIILTILLVISLLSISFVLFYQGRYENIDPISLNSDTEFSEFAKSNDLRGDGTEDNPYKLRNVMINDTVDFTLKLSNIKAHVIIERNYITGAQRDGIYLNHVENIIIRNNIFDQIAGDAIFVNGSSNVRIEDNMISNIDSVRIGSNNGIQNFPVSIDIQFSDSIIIQDNTISDSYDGIWLWGGVTNAVVKNNVITNMDLHGIGWGTAGSENITVEGNTISEVQFGMWIIQAPDSVVSENTLSDVFEGMRIFSNKVVIESNTITDASSYGINFRYITTAPSVGHENVVQYNTIMDGSVEAVNFDGINKRNVVANNNFINNFEDNPQIRDNGQNNTIEYNYYNEWLSPDEDNDGIVDEPYTIAGSASNVDPYPKTEEN